MFSFKCFNKVAPRSLIKFEKKIVYPESAGRVDARERKRSRNIILIRKGTAQRVLIIHAQELGLRELRAATGFIYREILGISRGHITFSTRK